MQATRDRLSSGTRNRPTCSSHSCAGRTSSAGVPSRRACSSSNTPRGKVDINAYPGHSGLALTVQAGAREARHQTGVVRIAAGAVRVTKTSSRHQRSSWRTSSSNGLFTFDPEDSHFVNNKCFFVPSDAGSTCSALLNSTVPLVSACITGSLAARRGTSKQKLSTVERLAIARAVEEQRQDLARLGRAPAPNAAATRFTVQSTVHHRILTRPCAARRRYSFRAARRSGGRSTSPTFRCGGEARPPQPTSPSRSAATGRPTSAKHGAKVRALDAAD